MAIELQYRREERLVREKQLRSGATLFTHIRPAPKRLSVAGGAARLRNGYGKRSYFGPPCRVVSSRQISNLSELLIDERQHLAPEFNSLERMRGRDWARAAKLEVLILRIELTTIES
jgi:hypothetical protein